MPHRHHFAHPHPARLTLLALGLLAAGALAGRVWHTVAVGVASAAVLTTVFLLQQIRHLANAHMAFTQSRLKSSPDRFMIRSRRLAASLNDLRVTASRLPDALVLIDRNDRIRWFNQAAEHLLGLRRPDDRGIKLDTRLARTELADWLQTGGIDPLNHVTAPGQPSRQIQVSLLPYGQQMRLLLARDISHMTRLEQVRRDFVANVSHELRTPLTVIHGYLELLDPEDMPDHVQILNEMRLQSKRMEQIVEDLLTLSRLETQNQVSEERVAITPLLATLRKEAEALSQGRHTIVLENHCERDLLGSMKDLHSAFSNLVSNAIRYTSTGGSITIRWQCNEAGAIYSVTDTGFGIAESHLARLTERFYRISSSRSRESGGTGLGLSIVKHVLNLHQARLEIRSVPGQGSTFACLFGPERLLKAESVEHDGPMTDLSD
ncbi:phosphate regulon sensor histidine kinase PhoR [Frateuria aurantia]